MISPAVQTEIKKLFGNKSKKIIFYLNHIFMNTHLLGVLGNDISKNDFRILV